MNDDKMVDISVKNLSRVHQRNRELSNAVRELMNYKEIVIVGDAKHNRTQNALALYRDLS